MHLITSIYYDLKSFIQSTIALFVVLVEFWLSLGIVGFIILLVLLSL